ncbi:DNA-binding protein [Streptococcus oralis subsp. tigurinus]|uniref:DNA-binding protein n=1 Tax=Streptococcus oralis subsp. tigurinus TaxID=1077464 RepID=A0A1X0WYE9_STROR|nr:helix-turn-helix transcriptional regulator [Streptococcus oralis]ORJ31813.1 DNA-binding protein [Streptococcus oralis subsp. tigurinus]
MKVFDGAKMRAIRKGAELTQYDLAPMVGISQNRVSDIERNVTTPTNEEIEAFADALNTQVSSFLSNESEIEVIANTFTKKKKDTDAESHFDNPTEQMELFVDDTLLGHDLTGYVLISQKTYLELLDSQDRLKQLQKLLKWGVCDEI